MKKKLTQIASSICIAAITLIGISACQKEKPSEIHNVDRIEQAKQWYGQQQNGTATMVQSAKGQVVGLEFSPTWEKAQVTRIDGKVAVVAPVTTNLQDIMGKQNEYHLVISVDNGRFTSKMVAINNLATNNVKLDAKELYQVAFNKIGLKPDRALNADVKVFDPGFKLAAQTLYKGTSREAVDHRASITLEEAVKMQKQQVTEVKFCTEWFLITFEYDDYGNIYNVHETSLGKSCETYYLETIDWIDNGPPTDANPEGMAALAATTLVPANDATGSFSTTSESAELREKAYSWTVLKNTVLGWSIRSHEVGTHEKISHNWQWKTLVHSGYTTPGKPGWINCDIIHGSAAATIGTYSAYITITLNVDANVGIRGVNIGPAAFDYTAQSPTWDMPYN